MYIHVRIDFASSVCRVVYCGKTVQYKHLVCIEVEYECGVDISTGTVLYLEVQNFVLRDIVI